jgi:transmembrane sensor
MKQKEKYYSDQFIAQWVSGVLSADQRSEFETWLKSHPEERDFFEEIELLWNNSEKIKIKKGLSQEERWDRISKELSMQPESEQKTFTYSTFWRFASIAAVLLIMIGYYFWQAGRGMVEIKSPRGIHQLVRLSDGSQVTLNAESRIEYDRNKWDKKREIILSGEAFFEVMKGKEFIVKSGFVITRVLGTEFNIRSGEEQVEVACLSGKVEIASDQRDHVPVILTPGYASMVVYDSIPKDPYRFDHDQTLGWMKGEFYFNSTPLEEVFSELEKQFNVKVQLKEEIGDQLFTGVVREGDIHSALDKICLSAGLRYSISGNSEIVIY